jgi:hypothetical protein
MRAISERGFMSKNSLSAIGHNINRGDNASASVDDSLSEDDFVIMCLFRDGGLDEAILSLYYLPPQFKLRVLIDAATAKLPFTGHDAVKSRISLETETGTPAQMSPFSNANAVVYSEATPVVSESDTPRVVISKAAQETTTSVDGPTTFTITEDSPEALASAVLRIAKATA